MMDNEDDFSEKVSVNPVQRTIVKQEGHIPCICSRMKVRKAS